MMGTSHPDIGAAPPFGDALVASAFAAIEAPARGRLLALRRLIFEVAAATPEVGAIKETLKWGQPAYLTPETGSGSTIRLGIPKSPHHGYALFVHCSTSLTQQFEAHYPGLFDYEGTRALLFRVEKEIPENALRHCIGLALTYRTGK